MRQAGLVCVLAIASTALADTPRSADALRAEGEGHAKRQEFAEAIASFKAADQVEPQAIYSCMIGLTYLRRNLLAQAELFLGRCHTRGRNEKLPAWVATADKQLAQVLADGKITTFVITVTPATTGATVKVSGFADDETFDPQTIHLPAGTYTLTVSAPSYPDLRKEVIALGTHDVQNIELALQQAPSPIEPPPIVKPIVTEPVVTKIEPPPVHETPREAPPRINRYGLALTITGGALALGGGVFHYLTWQKGHDLRDATTLPNAALDLPRSAMASTIASSPTNAAPFVEAAVASPSHAPASSSHARPPGLRVLLYALGVIAIFLAILVVKKQLRTHVRVDTRTAVQPAVEPASSPPDASAATMIPPDASEPAAVSDTVVDAAVIGPDAGTPMIKRRNPPDAGVGRDARPPW